MPIQETLTTLVRTSAIVAPASNASVFGVSGNFAGPVTLEAEIPGGGWFPVHQTSDRDFVAILTPDVAVSYRISSSLSSGEADVYFGP